LDASERRQVAFAVLFDNRVRAWRTFSSGRPVAPGRFPVVRHGLILWLDGSYFNVFVGVVPGI
jgi:hypothetical protein